MEQSGCEVVESEGSIASTWSEPSPALTGCAALDTPLTSLSLEPLGHEDQIT